MDKNILFVVEGDSDEVSFIDRLYKICYKKTEYHFFSYKTNIHILAKKIIENYPDFESDETEINQLLLSFETDTRKKELLRRKYTDIFMIFDFEPQHDTPHFDLIRRLVEYFIDSTNQGKLYINYPMMQSYKHFSFLPDSTFQNRKVSISDTYKYKRIVGDSSRYTDITKYTHLTFYNLCVHHIRKANYIITGNYSLPSPDEFILWKASTIFDYQLEMKNNKGEIYVLNTCIFILPEYAPRKFFDFISKHTNELSI